MSKKIATSRGILTGCRCQLWEETNGIFKNQRIRNTKTQGCGKYLEDIIEKAFSKKVRVEFSDCVIDESYKVKYLEQKI